MKFRVEFECVWPGPEPMDDGFSDDQRVARILRQLADNIDKRALRPSGGCEVHDTGDAGVIGYCGYRSSGLSR